MEPLYFVMAIMGCGDAGAQCQQVRVEPIRYQNTMQCQAAMMDVLQRSSDIPYPVVQAACQKRGMTMADRGNSPRG